MKADFRLARALPLLGALAAAALLATQVIAWRGLQRAVDAANVGQAEVIFDRLRAEMDGAPPSAAELTRFVAEQEDLGVTYLAVIGEQVNVEVGERRLGPLRAVPEGRVVHADGIARATWRPHRRPPGHGPPPLSVGPHPPGVGPSDPGTRSPGGGPPAGQDPGTPPPFDGPPAGFQDAPVHWVEFTPKLGAVLREDAIRTLLASGVAALLFLVLAFALRQALREREEQARVADRDRRLALLGEMSATLAHEIRNPLASLKGHAQLLVEQLPDDKTGAKAKRVVAEAARLEELTDNLLSYVRSGRLKLEKLELLALCEEVAETIEGPIDVQGSPVTIDGDPARLRQALVNLLTNAREASGAEPVEIRIEQDDEGIRLEIRDRGAGLGDSIDKLFEPFHTRRDGGTGLGLAIARQVVEGHGATIEGRDRPEGGAVFTLVFPFATTE